MAFRILLAEDEKQLSRVFKMGLEHKGYQVHQAYDGQEALQLAQQNHYDLMIFDVMMPKVTGVEAVKSLREMGDTTHIMLLTAMSELEDKIVGLESGADDYLTKPISLQELLVRVASLERRLTQFSSAKLQLNNLIFDSTELEIQAENTMRLSGKESQLLGFLMHNTDKVLSKAEIFQHVWDEEDGEDESIVDMYVAYLRQKLKAVRANVQLLDLNQDSFQLVPVTIDQGVDAHD